MSRIEIENVNGSANMRGIGTEREIGRETRGNGAVIAIASGIGIDKPISLRSPTLNATISKDGLSAERGDT